MANRRMFAKTIVSSDAFLSLPYKTQCLYFQLNMAADDDGVVNNAKSIIAMSKASKNDYKNLIDNKFIIELDNLTIIKHWKINNYIQRDRYTPSKYSETINKLEIDENGSYTNKTNETKKSIEESECIKVNKESNAEYNAKEIRKQAKKESELPYSFDYKIRQAFAYKKCPICNCIMDPYNDYLKPSIQHNVPLTIGGKHELTNISVICRHCNSSIQNNQITGELNNKEVIKEWEKIIAKENDNVYDSVYKNVYKKDTQVSIGKDNIDKDNNYNINNINDLFIIYKNNYLDHKPNNAEWSQFISLIEQHGQDIVTRALIQTKETKHSSIDDLINEIETIERNNNNGNN